MSDVSLNLRDASAFFGYLRILFTLLSREMELDKFNGELVMPTLHILVFVSSFVFHVLLPSKYISYRELTPIDRFMIASRMLHEIPQRVLEPSLSAHNLPLNLIWLYNHPTAWEECHCHLLEL